MSENEDVVQVFLRRLDEAMPLPSYVHEHDAGADLPLRDDCELAPGERRLVGTGIAVAIPVGYAGMVHPRSGLAARNGLTIVNAPGTIDAGYTGEIKICLLNTDTAETIRLKRGDRIAQLIIQPVVRAQFTLVDELPSSERGTGGYGSSGQVAQWSQQGEINDL